MAFYEDPCWCSLKSGVHDTNRRQRCTVDVSYSFLTVLLNWDGRSCQSYLTLQIIKQWFIIIGGLLILALSVYVVFIHFLFRGWKKTSVYKIEFGFITIQITKMKTYCISPIKLMKDLECAYVCTHTYILWMCKCTMCAASVTDPRWCVHQSTWSCSRSPLKSITSSLDLLMLPWHHWDRAYRHGVICKICNGVGLMYGFCVQKVQQSA